MKFAAIDIGSNALRLLFCNVLNGKHDPVFKKAELIRIPLRLGEDAFLEGKISEKKIEKLIKSMKAFQCLIDVYDAIDYRACATSAMREASNSVEIIDRIKKETGIKIEVIDGSTEADIIYSNHIAEHLSNDNAYLYIDVGGGSTEITLFNKNKVVVSRSFNIGTIRMLHDKVSKELWGEFKDWIKDNTKGYKPLAAIGSGGNINKLFALSRKKQSKPISYSKLKSIYELLEAYSYEERIRELGLKPDRADVIMPASKIFLTIMRLAEIEKMYVPQIGLSDGIVHLLYEKNKSKLAAAN
ncbi:MAG: exopolyphosphatase [Bacteroidetes bacterium]|nr:exopolyphosphatase [Bacteroidota bacterium]